MLWIVVIGCRAIEGRAVYYVMISRRVVLPAFVLRTTKKRMMRIEREALVTTGIAVVDDNVAVVTCQWA